MKSTRLALIVAAAATTAAITTGCAAGPGAATLQIQPNFAAGAARDMQAQNVVVVLDPETGSAQLTGTVINNGGADDHISGVTINGKSLALTYPVSVDAHSAVNLASDNGVKLILKDSGLKPGIGSPVTLSFTDSGSISLNVETQANTGVYSKYQPSIGS